MKTPYTSCVLRYMQDASAEEFLNIGVLVYSKEARYVGCVFDTKKSRLTKAFADFDASGYSAVVDDFEDKAARLQRVWQSDQLGFEELPQDAGAVARMIWPDQGLSYRYGGVRGGLVRDLDYTLRYLFDRMVRSQYPPSERFSRDDIDVWRQFQAPLRERSVTDHITDYEINAEDFSIKFKYTFKNGATNVFLPLSFDLSNEETMQDKASKWIGNGHSIASVASREIGMFYILMGKPIDPSKMDGYEHQKHRLDKNFPMPHELFEEDGAELLARSVRRLLDEHEVTPHKKNGALK